MTADDFVLSSVLTDEGELYMHLNLIQHGISLSLGPYPHIREFTQMLAHVALRHYWRGRYFKPGEEAGGGRIRGAIAFRINGVRVGFTSEEWSH